MQRKSDLYITSMITDRIRRHEVLLQLIVEKKNYDFREKKNRHVTKERENFHKKTNKGGLNCRSEI